MGNVSSAGARRASARCSWRPPPPSRTPSGIAANAAFHEHQVDLAGNALLSRFYRELSVNLMMQVIRGGKLEAGAYLATEHGAIVDAFEAGELAAAQTAIRAHIDTGRADRARRARAGGRRALDGSA